MLNYGDEHFLAGRQKPISYKCGFTSKTDGSLYAQVLGGATVLTQVELCMLLLRE